jgi:molybdenum cofactor biosynthesis enzyme MoaA
MDPNALEAVLATNRFEKIEITGGGEPSLHQDVEKIVRICADHCPTQIYTNGNYTPLASELLICLSRAHYNDENNETIMGVNYDIAKYSNPKNLKLSLMLHQSGISNTAEVLKYLKWAKKYASKVVVRQLFEYEGARYAKYYASEYVSSIQIAEELAKSYKPKIVEGNYFFDIDGLEVEFECRACACEDTNPVFGADNRLVNGWSEL